MNSHDLILSAYCGVNQATPIMGEVQHSFFVSTHHFDVSGRIGPPRSSGRNPLVPLFSWNNILKFRFQIPIGDPLQYSDGFEQIKHDGRSPGATPEDILIMPKKNDELAPLDRLADYSRLIEFAKQFSESGRLVLSLHPADADLQDQLHKTFDFLILPERSQEAPSLSTQLMRLSRAKMIVSDYLGAHVIRANAYFGAQIVIPSSSSLPKAVDPHLRPYLEELANNSSLNSAEVRSISQILVGTKHKKSAEELREILYRPDQNEMVRKFRIGVYKKGRRARVWVRQSKWLGKSNLMKKLRRHIAERIWDAKFN